MSIFTTAFYIFGVYSAFCYGFAAAWVLTNFMFNPESGDLSSKEKSGIYLAVAVAPVSLPMLILYISILTPIKFRSPHGN